MQTQQIIPRFPRWLKPYTTTDTSVDAYHEITDSGRADNLRSKLYAYARSCGPVREGDGEVCSHCKKGIVGGFTDSEACDIVLGEGYYTSGAPRFTELRGGKPDAEGGPTLPIRIWRTAHRRRTPRGSTAYINTAFRDEEIG